MPSLHIPQGFTLIELMITLAIVAVLTTLAMPFYQNYLNKARFSAIISAAEPVKTALEICMQTHMLNADDTKGSTPCLNATQSFTFDKSDATDDISSLEVTKDPNYSGIGYQITVTSRKLTTSTHQAATFQLTGDMAHQSGQIHWTRGGTCLIQGWC